MNADPEIITLSQASPTPRELPAACEPAFADALLQLDRSSGPLGLYALAESQREPGKARSFAAEWALALKPALRAFGCGTQEPNRRCCEQGEFHFVRNKAAGRLQFVRLSTIKVRRYGNAYRVDPHLDFESRWRSLRIEDHLKSALSCRGEYRHQHVVFLGFAADPEPFHRELAELQGAISFGKQFQKASQTVWDDPHGRGFRTLVACWTLPISRVQP